jgi:hypothetical protein
MSENLKSTFRLPGLSIRLSRWSIIFGRQFVLEAERGLSCVENVSPGFSSLVIYINRRPGFLKKFSTLTIRLEEVGLLSPIPSYLKE